MEEISELIKIVTRHTRKNLPLIDLKAQDDGDNKELKLFLGVRSNEYLTDQAASIGIYGEEEVDFKFRMLKSRLNKKLLNHLFFMDFGISKLHKSITFHQECLDYLHFSKLLLKVGEIKLATKLIYKTIDLAKECEFNDVLVTCFKELRDIYASTYRPKLFQSTTSQIEEYTALVEKEEEAQSIYFEQKLFLNSSITNRKKDLNSVKKAIGKLDKIYQQTQSYNIYEKKLKLSIWLHEFEGDFDEVIKIVDRSEEDFKKGKTNQTRYNQDSFRIAKIYAFLKLNRLEEGARLAAKCLKETDRESVNWYAFQENYLQIAIRKKDYELAISLLNEAFSNKNFNEQEETSIERWHLYRAYLYYLTGEKSLTKYINYSQIIENIPEFQKDKAGPNVAMLILQVLTHLDADLAKLHQILSAMDDYVNKYLNNSFSKRTKVFNKLLHKVVAHNRDYDQINQKSKYLTEKLSEIELEGDVFADMEIIPYDQLWEIIVHRLSVMRYQNL